jgi:hypothetical protein
LSSPDRLPVLPWCYPPPTIVIAPLLLVGCSNLASNSTLVHHATSAMIEYIHFSSCPGVAIVLDQRSHRPTSQYQSCCSPDWHGRIARQRQGVSGFPDVAPVLDQHSHRPTSPYQVCCGPDLSLTSTRVHHTSSAGSELALFHVTLPSSLSLVIKCTRRSRVAHSPKSLTRLYSLTLPARYALALAKKKMNVVLIARSKDKLKSVADEIKALG